MYTSPVTLILGFHGCDRKVGESILGGKAGHLHKSENRYDWLGHGIYFWENNPVRALEFAEELQAFPRSGKQTIKEVFAVGAMIDPGHCLNLMESGSLRLLQEAYALLAELSEKRGARMPVNKRAVDSGELLQRDLDCAVIEVLCSSVDIPYDTVRGVFWEGSELYPGAGFREKNHIQICVRNPSCIKGYFRPLA
ncbi:MAG: hypothetical protein HYV27_02415 [Candidatus Hydrogenedentes bacterium]|nr:hypothetical protein [Candidatus Hydrogenedentota bacterium]